MPSTESLKERLLGHGWVRRRPSPNQLRSQLRLLDIYNPTETNQAHRPVKNHTPVCRCQSAQSLCRCEERMTKGLEPTNNAGSVRFVLLVASFSPCAVESIDEFREWSRGCRVLDCNQLSSLVW